jgi:hypothetical protein
MKYSRYLEAFYRSYSRRTAKGRDNVQFRYHDGYRVTFWSYNTQVIAIAASREYNGTRYLLLRQPQNQKNKKAISGRIDSILLRFSDLYKERPAWKNGSLLLYLPGHNVARKQTNVSIEERIKQIWND